MKSKESQVAAQMRLNQWALEVQECMNRPEGMTVDEWCRQHNIKKANYYWRLKRVRQTCLEQLGTASGSFVELPVPAPAPSTLSSAPVPATISSNPATMAVLHASGGISIEIKNNATAEFIKNLIGAFVNA